MSADDDNTEQLEKCRAYVKDAILKTIEEFYPRLAEMFELQPEEVREMVTWAAFSIAIANGTRFSLMDDEQRFGLLLHMNYMLDGAVKVNPKLDETASTSSLENPESIPPKYDGWKPDPIAAASTFAEGVAFMESHQFERAIEKFEEAITLDWTHCDPVENDYFHARAKAYLYSGNDRPDRACDRYNDGGSYAEKRRYKDSAAAYEDAIRLDPGFLWAPNNLAWLYATCTEPQVRNGKLAVSYASSACMKSQWHCWSFIGTLAAAYAEAGDFERAILCSRRTILLAPFEKKAQEEKMLKSFENGNAYHED